MANWCDNIVEFFGEEWAVAMVMQLFEEMKEREKINPGQLPYFIDSKDGHFCGINISGSKVTYETSWYPNTGVLLTVADHYQVSFRLIFEEHTNCIYGAARYRNRELDELELKYIEYEKYFQNKETGLWHYEGLKYNSEWEILEMLMDRKRFNQSVLINHPPQTN